MCNTFRSTATTGAVETTPVAVREIIPSPNASIGSLKIKFYSVYCRTRIYFTRMEYVHTVFTHFKIMFYSYFPVFYMFHMRVHAFHAIYTNVSDLFYVSFRCI